MNVLNKLNELIDESDNLLKEDIDYDIPKNGNVRLIYRCIFRMVGHELIVNNKLNGSISVYDHGDCDIIISILSHINALDQKLIVELKNKPILYEEIIEEARIKLFPLIQTIINLERGEVMYLW